MRGTLRITAPNIIGREVISPVLWEMLKSNPALRVDLHLSDHRVDLAADGFDVAIRIGTNLPSEMIATRIGNCPRVLCVSPDYIARNGRPTTLEELEGHSCISLEGITSWPFSSGEKGREFRPTGRFVANAIDGIRAACAAGVGIAFVVDLDVTQLVEDGTLELLELDDAKPVELVMWAIFPTRQQVPARVRHLIEALRNRISSIPKT